MSWTTPEFVEIKMDAEIGAYQQDDFFEPSRDPTTPEPPSSVVDSSASVE